MHSYCYAERYSSFIRDTGDLVGNLLLPVLETRGILGELKINSPYKHNEDILIPIIIICCF